MTSISDSLSEKCLGRICSFLRKEDLEHFRLVQKRWGDIASGHLFQRLHLSLRECSPELPEFLKSAQVAGRVHSLTCSKIHETETPFGCCLLTQAVATFTNLREITVFVGYPLEKKGKRFLSPENWFATNEYCDEDEYGDECSDAASHVEADEDIGIEEMTWLGTAVNKAKASIRTLRVKWFSSEIFLGDKPAFQPETWLSLSRLDLWLVSWEMDHLEMRKSLAQLTNLEYLHIAFDVTTAYTQPNLEHFLAKDARWKRINTVSLEGFSVTPQGMADTILHSDWKSSLRSLHLAFFEVREGTVTTLMEVIKLMVLQEVSLSGMIMCGNQAWGAEAWLPALMPNKINFTDQDGECDTSAAGNI